MTFTLLPAVDVADGTAVRLVHGAAGSETRVRRPARGRAGLAARRRRLGAPGRPRRRVRPRLERAAAGRGDRGAGRGRRAVRRDPGRRVAGRRAGHRRPPGQHRHRRAGAAGLGGPGDRRARRPDRGRAGRARRHAVRPRLDPGRRRPVGDAGPARRRRAARGTWSPTSAGTARWPGPNLDLYRRLCAATEAPVVASGGVTSLDDLRALAALAPLGVEGAIVGKALYAGAFTLPEALTAAVGAPERRRPAPGTAPSRWERAA